MSGLYPAYIRLENRRCVVVGGGPVAERKVNTLLECRAQVTIISPVFCAGLRHLADENKVDAIWREYRRGDLAGAFLAIAATDSEEVNAAVAVESDDRGVLVCVVDHPRKGNLLIPTAIRRGDLAVSISTGGRCPALAKKLRMHLEASLIPEYAQLLDLASQVREDAKRKGVRIGAATWQELLSAEIIDLVRRGMVNQAKERVLSILGADVNGLERDPVQSEGGAS